MSIEVNDESGFQPAQNLAEIAALATYVLDQMRVHPQAELNVILVDEAAIERLHIEWMDLPGPTDVLSFPMDELRPGTEDAPSPEGILGDIVVCPSVAERQAAAAGHAAIEEMLERFDTLVLLKVSPVLDEVIDLLDRRGLLAAARFIEKVGAPEERVVHDVASLRGGKVNYLSLMLVRNKA